MAKMPMEYENLWESVTLNPTQSAITVSAKGDLLQLSVNGVTGGNKSITMSKTLQNSNYYLIPIFSGNTFNGFAQISGNSLTITMFDGTKASYGGALLM